MDKQPQILGALAVQPYFLTVGKEGGFATGADFYRFLADECGVEAVTIPACEPFINVDLALTSAAYRDDFQATLRGYRLKHGCRRIEQHVIGQNVCLHKSRRLKFGQFLDKQNFRNMTVAQMEKQAADTMLKFIKLSELMGFRDIPGFPGGRGYAVAQAKWAAYAPYFKLWTLALLAFKWIPILEAAADRGQTITFELGHPEEDLLTGANFVLFWSLLTVKARTAVGLNGDGSHFWNVGSNPIPHFRHVRTKTKCRVTNHYKGGLEKENEEVYDNATFSPYGGFENWSEASTTFFSFGVVGDITLAEEFDTFMTECHETQEGGVDKVWEGECTGIMNPRQAMIVGTHNTRVVNKGKMYRLAGVVEEGRNHIDRHRPVIDGTPRLLGPDGNVIELEAWAGGPFDAAFNIDPVTSPEILDMTPEETRGTMALLEAAGYTDAAAVGHEYLKLLAA